MHFNLFSRFKSIIRSIVAPISADEDLARNEFITNVLLVGIIFLSFVAFSVNAIKVLMGGSVSVPPVGGMGVVLFLIGLYWLSRKGLARWSAYGLLGFVFSLAFFMSYQWGVDVPFSILTYGMVIMMSGILLGSRVVVFVTLFISAALFGLGLFQQNGVLRVDRSWHALSWESTDTLVMCIMFFMVATVCWLSNREIEKSLRRARASEATLMQERDQLEVTVQERTRQIQEIQAEKIAQLYRFAEFGKLSSGLFHDLLNPLNSVSLNIERLKMGRETSEDLERAVSAAQKLQQLVVSVRRQLGREEAFSRFSVNEEIPHVFDVLMYKAQAASVTLLFPAVEPVYLFGSPLKFNQIVLNLVANAIDAYIALPPGHAAEGVSREVRLSLWTEPETIVLQVHDQGIGIPSSVLPQLFQPFFTTKAQGHGIGLSMVKRIVEKEFHGTISVDSGPQGTVFTVRFPIPEAV